MSCLEQLIEDGQPSTVNRSPFTPHRSDKEDKRTLDSVASIQNARQVVGESEPPAQFELRLQLTRRTESDIEETRPLFLPGPTTPFCDVRGNRDGGPPHLSRKVEPFVRRENIGQPVHLHNEVCGFLPDSELAILLHSPSLHRFRDRCKDSNTGDSVIERSTVNGQRSTVNGESQ